MAFAGMEWRAHQEAIEVCLKVTGGLIDHSTTTPGSNENKYTTPPCAILARTGDGDDLMLFICKVPAYPGQCACRYPWPHLYMDGPKPKATEILLIPKQGSIRDQILRVPSNVDGKAHLTRLC